MPVSLAMFGKPLEEERRALEKKAPNDPFAIGQLAKDYAIAGRYKEAALPQKARKGWHLDVGMLFKTEGIGCATRAQLV
jgi:hypothetical protein